MKFDPRIKSIDSIKSFNTNNYDCLGKFGYFTNSVENFENLDEVRKGICVFKDGCRFPFHADSIENQKFQFFIPENELLPKEKRYRPYTLMEFNDKFTVGRPIKFREKGREGCERYLILNGYMHEQREGQTSTYIYIGSYPYTLDELFHAYEWQVHYTEDFEPFGVEVEVEE